jgi:ring-1,2-phenylacetyl-CoA epoxidase subunit PaaC
MRDAMEETTKAALCEYLLALADDELILGHRDSEWCGHAPLLEEDIAFANLALDELGHAQVWYTLLAELQGEEAEDYPDQLVFFRPAHAFRNIQMVELPNHDWAFSMLRQYLFDAYELLNLEALEGSSYRPLAEAAGKIRLEEIYHHRHVRAWVQRLALGTEESHGRMQNALNALWAYGGQLFSHTPGDKYLAEKAVIPKPDELREKWIAQVQPFLTGCELQVPGPLPASEDRTRHTAHLEILVREMSSVARMEAAADW